MFNAASKLYFTVAALAVVFGFVYVVTSGDRVGFIVLVVAGVGALVLALTAFAFVPREAVAVGGAEPAEARSADVTDVPRSAPWPLIGAVAIALLAVGMATDHVYVVLGAIVAAIAIFTWFAQSWREHPSWTQAMTDRINDRFVVPVGLPGTVLVLAGIAVISASRLLLAVSAEAAPILIIVVAAAVLGGFYLLANGNVGRRAIGGLAAVCAALVLAAGVAGALKGEREFHHEEQEGTYRLVAKDITFDKTELDFPATTEIKLEFDNEDTGQPHNFSLYERQGGSAIFQGPLANKGKTAYDFVSPKAGTYFFQCDVHPTQMQGTVVVSVESNNESDAGTSVTTVR